VNVLSRQKGSAVKCAWVPVVQRQPAFREQGKLVIGMQFRQRVSPSFGVKPTRMPPVSGRKPSAVSTPFRLSSIR